MVKYAPTPIIALSSHFVLRFRLVGAYLRHYTRVFIPMVLMPTFWCWGQRGGGMLGGVDGRGDLMPSGPI